MKRAIRVLLAKPGLDGHDRGALVVAKALREAGMEVAYTGIRWTPEAIGEEASKGYDVLGLSILSGAHLTLVPRVLAAMEQQGVSAGGMLVIVGGVIPEEDIPALRELGVEAVFGPGTDTNRVISFVLNHFHRDSSSDR
jgi:methylmalonyl-CoA mutase C-terminal domain/subunit